MINQERTKNLPLKLVQIDSHSASAGTPPLIAQRIKAYVKR
jgi:hypothetical protein